MRCLILNFLLLVLQIWFKLSLGSINNRLRVSKTFPNELHKLNPWLYTYTFALENDAAKRVKFESITPIMLKCFFPTGFQETFLGHCLLGWWLAWPKWYKSKQSFIILCISALVYLIRANVTKASTRAETFAWVPAMTVYLIATSLIFLLWPAKFCRRFYQQKVAISVKQLILLQSGAELSTCKAVLTNSERFFQLQNGVF